MTDTVLCADIGTTSLKAAIVDARGNVLASARRQFLLCYTHEAASEWKKAFIHAAFDCLNQAGLHTVDAICISGNGPTLVASTTGKTILWNQETPSCPPSLFIPKLLYLKQNFYDDFDISTKIFSGPEYLIWQLTGNAFTILPEKRYEAAYWTPEQLENAGFTRDEIKKLPDFAKPGDFAGTFLLNGKMTPVFCGAPDFVSALAGTATLRPGRLCDRAGSSEGLNLCTDRPVTGPSIRTLPSVIPGLWNASYLIPESGSRLNAYKGQVERLTGREYTFAQMVNGFLTSDGSDPLMEQGKNLLEETAALIRQGVETLCQAAEKAGCQVPEYMTVTGGQSANSLWNQFKARATGMKLVIPQIHDAELLGDAVFAFTGMGVFQNYPEAADVLFKTGETYIPEQEEI